MENTADGQNKFQDLLSAALSESGLGDDLNDAAADHLQNDIVNIPSNVHAPTIGAVSYVPVHTVVQAPQTVITRVQPGNIPCSVVRVPTATTRVRTVTANSTNAGVKRIIVRAVVPQSLAGRRFSVPVSGQMVNIARSTAGTQGLPGNIRVIRIPVSSGSKVVTLPLSTKSGGKIVLPASALSGQMTGAPKIVTFGSATNSGVPNRGVPVNISNAVTSTGKSAMTQVLLPQGSVPVSLRNVTAGTHNHIALVTQASGVSSIIRLVSASASGTMQSSADVVQRTVSVAMPTTVLSVAPSSATSSSVQQVVRVTSQPRTQQQQQQKVALTNVGNSAIVGVHSAASVAGFNAPITSRLVATNTTANVVSVTSSSTKIGQSSSDVVNFDKTDGGSDNSSAVQVTGVATTALTSASVTHASAAPPSTDPPATVVVDGDVNPTVTVSSCEATAVTSADSVVHSEDVTMEEAASSTVEDKTGTNTRDHEEKAIESTSEGISMDFGSCDADLFSQALMQLTDTNAKAAEFEAEMKAKNTATTTAAKTTPARSVVAAPKPTMQSVQSSHPTIGQITAAPASTTVRVIPACPGTQPSMNAGTHMVNLSQSLLRQTTYPLTPGSVQGSATPQGNVIRISMPKSSIGGATRSIVIPSGLLGNAMVRMQQPQGIVGMQQIRLPVRGQAVYSTSGGVRQQAFVGQSQRNVVYTTKVLPSGMVQPLATARYGIPPGGAGVRTTMLSMGQKLFPAGTTVMVNSRSRSNSPAPVVYGSADGASLSNGMIKAKLTDRDVSRLWVNEDLKLKKMNVFNPVEAGQMGYMYDVEEEVEEAEEEELGHTETYANYMPAKLKLGQRHPDPVVETSSLSSVEPSNIWYHLSIPESTIDYGYLSALQLEAVVYTCQKHQVFLPSGDRAGFLIGDGAGVGKGRTIAGIIYENYLQGRKRSLWLSVSNDLRVDAERDLRDIGAGKIEVYPLNKFKYAKISSHINNSVKKGVIFATYSSLIGESQSGGKYRTRFKQLLHWMGKEFDGVVVFDECHKAKNLCPVGSSKPTKTGMTVLELQKRLPKARIVYASATGASEPKNMAYMTRLGLWGPGTPFREFSDFIQAVEKRGVGAMEMVAMDMKLRGMYIARQLSFQGVTFRIEEISISENYKNIYNAAVTLWVDARDKFQRAADLIDAEQRMKKGMWGQFWSAHQRFFKYLCISAKVAHCVQLVREAVKNGKCVVIGLQSTGEARTLEQLEECGGELNDFVSTAKGVFQTLVEKHFPAPDRRKTHDLFGLGSSLFGESPQSSPTPLSGKRKKDLGSKGKKKRKMKSGFSDDSDDSNSKDKGDSSSAPTSASDSDSAQSGSDSDDMDGDSGDSNPFGSGSDSDDDPWLKKAKVKKDKRKMKQKKAKKKKKKKKHSKKSKKKDDSDLDSDIDDQFDKALEAAGLKATSENSSNPFSQFTNKKTPLAPGMDAVDAAIAMKADLLEKIEKLGDKLPPNTIDELIDSFGGPEAVAEMTGRKGRVVSTENGSIQYESRSEIDVPLEILNLTEKQRFMDGEKNIAIISEAASSGISLQADRREINQKRRVHITLELPWSADRAIQQFGRTHRSNQVSAPQYVFLISELAGERRFASTVAKRLESLGALTHGDRRATEIRDLSRFNIDNKYGRAALESTMKSIVGLEAPLVKPPAEYPGNFFEDAKTALIGVGLLTIDERYGMPVLEKDYNSISKFLNRLLGIEVTLQNAFFRYFMNTLAAIILQAKRNGRWDMGILDLGAGSEDVKKIHTKTFVGNFSGTTTKTELHTVVVERGLQWEAALDIWKDHTGNDDGFYISSQVRNEKRTAVLVTLMTRKKRERLYGVYRPNTGLQPRYEALEELKKKYRKVLPDEARDYWQDQYNTSATVCVHAYWKGNCKRANVGLSCEVGLRTRTYHILSGSVLSVWTKVESVLASLPGGNATRMQIIRLRTDDGKRIVGSLIPSVALQPLINVLSQNSDKMIDTQHAAPPSEAGDASQHLMSTQQLTGRVPVSTQGSCLAGQSNNNWPQQPPQPQQHLSMPMFL